MYSVVKAVEHDDLCHLDFGCTLRSGQLLSVPFPGNKISCLLISYLMIVVLIRRSVH